jgi:hypothetical protein
MPTVEEIQAEVVASNAAVNETLKKISDELKVHKTDIDAMKAKGDRPEASAEHSAKMADLERTLDGATTALAAAQAELQTLKTESTQRLDELQKALQRGGLGSAEEEPYETVGAKVIKAIEEQRDKFAAYAQGTISVGNLNGLALEGFAKEPAFLGYAPQDVRKALASTTTTNFIAPMQLPGYIPLTRRSLRMRDLLPIVPMTTGSHGLYIRQKGFTTAAAGSSVTSITQTGGLATVTQTAHGYEDQDRIQISGANQAGYNKSAYIKVLTANTYTYAVDSGTVSPATGTIVALRMNNYGAAGFVAEGDTKPEAAMFFEERTFQVQLIAHYMETTRQVLDDMPGLRQNIDSDLIYGLLLKEDKSLLYATGAGGQISGLLTDPDRQHYLWSEGESDDTKADAIRRARTRVELADFESTGVVVHPKVWEEIELEKGSDGHYLWVQVGGMNGLDPAGQRIWRMPMVTTRAIAYDTFLTGAFAQAATIYDRMQAKILFADQHGTNFTKNVLTILAEERLGLAVRRPEAFVEGTFDSAPA